MTNQEIIDKAKAILEVEIDGFIDTTWAPQLFLDWLQEAYLFIISYVKKQLLTFLYVDYSISNVTTSLTLQDDVLLLVSVKRNDYDCDIVNNVLDFGSKYFKGTETEPVCYRSKNILKFLPTTEATIIYKYVKQPSLVLSNQSDFPLSWQNFIHFYIVAQGLAKDRQDNRVSFYLNLFNNSLELLSEK